MRAARSLSVALVVVMALQASLGLLLQGSYRDADWIRATWFGNDWVTLILALPLLVASLRRADRGPRGMLLWFGLVAYALYNYAFYLLGAVLNVFFPLYVLAVLLAGAVLILGLASVAPGRVAGSFRMTTPARSLGGALIIIGTGLGSVWIGTWAAHVFAGRPTPVAPDVFRLVAALDLTLMVPALVSGGVLLWRRRPWGYVIAAIAGVQAALYLVVLSVNSLVAIRRGFAEPPGELLIWGSLAVFTTAVSVVLLGNSQDQGT
jgi:hypothetical protein